MSLGFWKNLKEETSRAGRGIFVLAPMADVTDPAFRRIITKYGKPDVLWTEFVSADGLALAPEEGKRKLLRNFEYTEEERPIVAQLFSSNPEHMESATRLVQELGFDGVDINMGCPDRSVEKQGAGAALMKDAERARALIRAAKKGAPKIPVSIKIRLGYNKPVLDEWLPEVLKEEPAVVTVHARTRKEMSKVPARWEFVKRAVEIRNEFALRQAQGKNERTLIFGNGDVVDLADAQRKVEETGCDGVMFGRAIFGNPWLFAGLRNRKEYVAKKITEVSSAEELPDSPAVAVQNDFLSQHIPSVQEKLNVLVEHTKLFEKLLGDLKSFAIMKKHFKAYVSGFPGAVELRQELMETENADEVEKVVDRFLKEE